MSQKLEQLKHQKEVIASSLSQKEQELSLRSRDMTSPRESVASAIQNVEAALLKEELESLHLELRGIDDQIVVSAFTNLERLSARGFVLPEILEYWQEKRQKILEQGFSPPPEIINPEPEIKEQPVSAPIFNIEDPYWREQMIQIYRNSGIPIPESFLIHSAEETVSKVQVQPELDEEVGALLPEYPLVKIEVVPRGKGTDLKIDLVVRTLVTGQVSVIPNKKDALWVAIIQDKNLPAADGTIGRPAGAQDLVTVPKTTNEKTKAIEDVEIGIGRINSMFRQNRMGVKIIDVRKFNELSPRLILTAEASKISGETELTAEEKERKEIFQRFGHITHLMVRNKDVVMEVMGKEMSSAERTSFLQWLRRTRIDLGFNPGDFYNQQNIDFIKAEKTLVQWFFDFIGSANEEDLDTLPESVQQLIVITLSANQKLDFLGECLTGSKIIILEFDFQKIVEGTWFNQRKGQTRFTS